MRHRWKGSEGMAIKVSVIIPVYNAEKYLAECVQSLISQTLRECEFIFVNDGSRDGSQAIVERFHREDSRIRLINQDNAGVSAARNAGVAAARGEYIGFVDADDWVKADMYETLYQAARRFECDVVFSDYFGEMDGRVIQERSNFPAGKLLEKGYICKEILPVFLESDRLNSVCNKIYRKEVIRACRIAFPTGIALGEDGLFNMRALCAIDKACYVEYAGYYYRETAGSATRKNKEQEHYFDRALQVYVEPLPDDFKTALHHVDIQSLRAKKFIRSCISLIHLYYGPSNPVHFYQKIAYVRKMIHHSVFQQALANYPPAARLNNGRYEHVFLLLIRLKSALGLYGVTAYSRLRNQKTMGG